jgi:DNA polymerase III delta prime subunit
MQTEILAQDEAVQICTQALERPTHLFFYGQHGLGKTTLALNFLDSYARKYGLQPRDPDFFLLLTADQDRGIHTVRAKLADFTRGLAKRPGILRWILIDDADTLPEVSQQALRRPMEQFSHLTCFLFIAHNSECLNHALQSRCQPVRFIPVPVMLYLDELLKRFQYTIKDDSVRSWIGAASLSSIAEMKRMIETLQWIAPTSPTVQDAKEICSTYDYEKILPLTKAISFKQPEALYTHMANLWQNGMSFEDILHAIQQTADLYLVLPSQAQERLYRFLVTGWAYHAQSRCSFLDLLCCSSDSGLLSSTPTTTSTPSASSDKVC